MAHLLLCSHLGFESCSWKTNFPIKKWSHGRNVAKKGKMYELQS
jgi:hypothetical protein